MHKLPLTKDLLQPQFNGYKLAFDLLQFHGTVPFADEVQKHTPIQTQVEDGKQSFSDMTLALKTNYLVASTGSDRSLYVLDAKGVWSLSLKGSAIFRRCHTFGPDSRDRNTSIAKLLIFRNEEHKLNQLHSVDIEAKHVASVLDVISTGDESAQVLLYSLSSVQHGQTRTYTHCVSVYSITSEKCHVLYELKCLSAMNFARPVCARLLPHGGFLLVSPHNFQVEDESSATQVSALRSKESNSDMEVACHLVVANADGTIAHSLSLEDLNRKFLCSTFCNNFQLEEDGRTCSLDLGLEYDVNLVIQRMRITHSPKSGYQVEFKHISTFGGIAFVQSGKEHKKHFSVSDDHRLCMIAEYSKFTYVFERPGDHAASSRQQIIEFESPEPVLGALTTKTPLQILPIECQHHTLVLLLTTQGALVYSYGP